MQDTDVAAALERRLHERIDGIGACEDDPVERGGRCRGGQERARVLWWGDSNDRGLDRFSAEGGESIAEVGGLLTRPRDEHAPAEERPDVVPPEMLSQAGDAADN